MGAERPDRKDQRVRCALEHGGGAGRDQDPPGRALAARARPGPPGRPRRPGRPASGGRSWPASRRGGRLPSPRRLVGAARPPRRKPGRSRRGSTRGWWPSPRQADRPGGPATPTRRGTRPVGSCPCRPASRAAAAVPRVPVSADDAAWPSASASLGPVSGLALKQSASGGTSPDRTAGAPLADRLGRPNSQLEAGFPRPPHPALIRPRTRAPAGPCIACRHHNTVIHSKHDDN